MSHLPALLLLVNIRLTWLCFQLQRREPLVCKLQLLHLYISWQPPLTFHQIYPHCPPERFQKCHHGSHCNTPKHMQKCKDIFSFCIQKQIVILIKSILSRNKLYIATDRQVSHICKTKHCRGKKKKKKAWNTANCLRVANIAN